MLEFNYSGFYFPVIYVTKRPCITNSCQQVVRLAQWCCILECYVEKVVARVTSFRENMFFPFSRFRAYQVDCLKS